MAKMPIFTINAANHLNSLGFSAEDSMSSALSLDAKDCDLGMMRNKVVGNTIDALKKGLRFKGKYSVTCSNYNKPKSDGTVLPLFFVEVEIPGAGVFKGFCKEDQYDIYMGIDADQVQLDGTVLLKITDKGLGVDGIRGKLEPAVVKGLAFSFD